MSQEASRALKRKASELTASSPPKNPADTHCVATFDDLKPECLGVIFSYVDLKTRVRATRVSRAVYDAIDRYGFLLDTLSIKQSSILEFNVLDGHFLVNNKVPVAEADLANAVAWLTRRFKGHTFELVVQSHRLGQIGMDMFEQLHGLKRLRVIFNTVNSSQPRHCPGLVALLRQSADTLECLAIEVSVSKSLLAAIAKCRQLKSLAFEGRSSYSGKAPLSWPDLPLLERVHLAGTDKLVAALQDGLRAGRQSIELSTWSSLSCAGFGGPAASVTFRSDVNPLTLSDKLDESPPLKAALLLSDMPPWFRSRRRKLNAVQPSEWCKIIVGLHGHRVGKPQRELLIVAAERCAKSDYCELRSVLPAFRWERNAWLWPMCDDDAPLIDCMRTSAADVEGLSVRAVNAADADALLQLPAALRSRRQFELTTAALTVRLVLLPDLAADAGEEEGADDGSVYQSDDEYLTDDAEDGIDDDTLGDMVAGGVGQSDGDATAAGHSPP